MLEKCNSLPNLFTLLHPRVIEVISSGVNIVDTKKTKVENLLKLFKMSFPNANYSPQYIEWLYRENPAGEVIGFDMYDENQLVGHYACVPTNVDGRPGYLSLNTATHPNYQGRGIFKLLATETYQIVNSQKSFVIGVANSKSASAFIRHLQFELLGHLNLRLGQISAPVLGSKLWSSEELEWRVRNPKTNASLKSVENNLVIYKTRIDGTPFKLKTLIKASKGEFKDFSTFGLTVDWRRDSEPFLSLPKSLKPSPLALILRNFSEQPVVVNSWNFVDFDAF